MGAIKGRVIKRIACPGCRTKGEDKKGNNLVVFERPDGNKNAYCFSCEKYQEIDKEDGFKVVQNVKSLPFVYGHYLDIPDRKITKQTCEFYEYQIANFNGVIKHIAPYYNMKNILVKQKVRTVHNKEFRNHGEGTYKGLFGMNLFKPNKNQYVNITEGELDCMSIAQALKLRFPVVSLPDGWGSIRETFLFCMEWLCGWGGVNLGLDNDEQGEKATQIGIDLLCKVPVSVIKWPQQIKDANELLLASKGEDKIYRCVTQSTPVQPDCIIDLGTVVDQALEPVKPGFSFGIPALDQYCYGMRHHEFILLGAGSEVGKTTFFNQMALRLTDVHGQRIACLSYEQNEKQLTQRLVGNIIEKRIWIPDTEYDKEKARRLGKEKLTNKAFLIDPSKGLNDLDKILNIIMYVINVMKISWIFIDHLTWLATLISGDERRGLDLIMAEFAGIVKDYPCSIWAVSHLSKPSFYGAPGSNTQLSFEEGRRILATDFRGSQSLQYYPTTILALSRNVKKFDTITYLELLKNRIDNSHTGKRIELDFGNESGILTQHDRYKEYKPLVNVHDKINHQ